MAKKKNNRQARVTQEMISTFHIGQTSTKVLVRKKKKQRMSFIMQRKLFIYVINIRLDIVLTKNVKKKEKKRKVQSQMNIDNVQYCKKNDNHNNAITKSFS